MITSFTDWESGLYLQHHGIKGQKWGIRRYVNKDGSLTDAGRKHYGVSEGGNKRLDRAFSRQQNKLRRLSRNANVSEQKRISSIQGSKAAEAGLVGLAALGAAGYGLGKYVNPGRTTTITGPITPGGATIVRSAINQGAKISGQNIMNAMAPVASVALGKAAYHYIRKNIADYRITEVGHNKAVSRVKAQTEKMQKMFADTPYSRLLHNQNKTNNKNDKKR